MSRLSLVCRFMNRVLRQHAENSLFYCDTQIGMALALINSVRYFKSFITN